MPLWHYHPPQSPDPQWSKQTAPSECTEEELYELRKLPRYTSTQRFLQVLLFLVFAPIKIVLVIPYSILMGSVFMISCAVWRSLGRHDSGREFLKKLWEIIARIFLFLVGFHQIHFHGEYDDDARFIVANHTCFFDGWLFLPWGPRILGKREMLQFPLMRDNADVFQAIAVDRGSSNGLTSILKAVDKSSPPFLILPEGASTSGDYMLRFHLGAFLSDVPVQPAVIRYTLYGTSRSISHISFFHHQLWQLVVFLGIPSIRIDITFLESSTIKQIEDQSPRQFADFIALKIANALGCRYLSLSSRALFKPEEKK
jgi:1-acyl-sn-glycerol-3-phosphate acyltransferase